MPGETPPRAPVSAHRSGPLAQRLCDGAVAAFALWTVACHAVVFAGGTLRQLVAVAAACFILGAGLWFTRRLRASAAGAEAARPGAAGPAEPRLWSALLWGFAAVAVVLTLAAHRPAVDDAGYVHFAVSVADHPDRPMLRRDTFHGLPELPPAMWIYRVHSIELLAGALSWLTGLPALDFAHLVIPALAALLAPLAFARLFRILLPGRWIWAVAVALLFLLIVGDAHRGYGNLAFVRLHQGKAMLLTVVLPLLIAYGLAFARTPGRRRWFRLAAGQIAAIGLSSTALWLAPLVAGLALLCGLDRRRRPLRRLLLGVSASLYPVAVALVMSRRLLGVFDSATDKSGGALTAEALELVLGDGWTAVLAAVAVLAAWPLAKTPLQRRFAIVFPLGFLVFWNPLTARFVAENLTHPWTYWRVFWVLPLPALIAMVMTAPIEARRPARLPPGLRAVAVVVAAAVLFYTATQRHVLSSKNRVRWEVPRWKVPAEEIALACALVEHTRPGQPVLAAQGIAPWVVTLHGHPRPLVPRPHFLEMQEGALGVAEVERRLRLLEVVSRAGGAPGDAELLRQALGEHSLAAVALAREAAGAEMETVLRDAGMRPVVSSPGYALWARARAQAPRRCAGGYPPTLLSRSP